MIKLGSGIFVAALMLHTAAFAKAGAETQSPTPAVDVRERTEYYDVRGTTAADLVAQMRTLGPPTSFGHRSWAFTAWEVSAQYYLVPGTAGCVVSDPRARLEVVTTLPRWETMAGSSWRLRAQWNAMFANLTRHEQTHRTHAELAARMTVEALSALPPQADCPTADRAAQRALQAAVAASRRLSLEYDHATQFGATEGVSLQPKEESARKAAGFHYRN